MKNHLTIELVRIQFWVGRIKEERRRSGIGLNRRLASVQRRSGLIRLPFA